MGSEGLSALIPCMININWTEPKSIQNEKKHSIGSVFTMVILQQNMNYLTQAKVEFLI